MGGGEEKGVCLFLLSNDVRENILNWKMQEIKHLTLQFSTQDNIVKFEEKN